jgi:hypothetical protein
LRQMTATRPKAEGGLQSYITPLFSATLARNEKPSEIFNVTNLGHVIVRVEAYRAQGGMTPCFKCQRFGHV